MPPLKADQASSQSIVDRIAAQFEDRPEDVSQPHEETEETPVEEEAEAAPESEDAEIEYEGARYRIPKALEPAVMQKADYTQKTQQLAEERRKIEYAQKSLEAAKIRREFDESVAGDLQQLQLMESYLGQLKSVNVNDLPMEEGFKHWMQMQQLKEQRETLQKSIDGKREDYGKKAQEAIQNLRSQAHDLIKRQHPEFSDQTAKELRDHAKSIGYTDADFDMIELDPRAASMLYKTMKYDQLQASKSAAVQKASSAPPGAKPGSSNPMPNTVKEKLNYRKALSSAKTNREKELIIQKHLESRF